MKKHLSYIGTWLLAALMFASCSDFEEFFTPEDKDCVTLTLTMGGENLMTRATQIGDNNLNENTIDKIDIFLYPIGGTEQNAVYQKTISGINDDDSDGDKQHEVKTSISASDINALFPNGTTECVAFVIVNRPNDVTFTDTDIESLKKLELTCTAFTTLQNIDPEEEESYKKVSVPDNFVMSGQNNVTLNTQNRSISGEVEVYRSASKTTLEITNVVNKVQDSVNPDIWWYSLPSDIRIYFKNCKEKGHLDNIELDGWSDGKKTLKQIGMQEIAGNAGHYTSLTPLYSYATNWANNINNRASIIVVVPWAQGTETNNSGNYMETYYEIPINDSEERLDRNTYYKLALEIGVVGSLQEEQPLEILNCSYIILPWGTGHSDIEASLAAVRYLVVDEKAVVMNNIISYRINFSSSHPVEIREGSMILKRRDLTKSNATWNDQPQSTSNPGGLRIVNGVPDYFRVPLKSDETGTYMLIEHDLVNNMDKNSDYSDYYMEFIIQHTDNEQYSQKITVTQHPMVVAEAELNSDYEESTGSDHNDHGGYVYINGVGKYARGRERTQTIRTYSYNQQDWNYYDYDWQSGGWSGYTTKTWFELGGYNKETYGGGSGLLGQNKNPNRYIINATSLTTDNFIIGDPRTTYINNNLSSATESTQPSSWSVYVNTNAENINGSASIVSETYSNYYRYWIRTYQRQQYQLDNGYYGAYAMYRNGNQNKLTYYYPTDETSRTKKMIAPKYMVASSYGVTGPISKENARKRCASYQEDGYPAGRWRLPTQAEVEYIVQLSAWKSIPVLFGSVPETGTSSTNYWTANGMVNVSYNANGDGTTSASSSTDDSYVRCVYDLWYWTDKTTDKGFTLNQYVWGDKAR